MMLCGSMNGLANNVTFETEFQCAEPMRSQYVIVQGHMPAFYVCELEVYSRLSNYIL